LTWNADAKSNRRIFASANGDSLWNEWQGVSTTDAGHQASSGLRQEERRRAQGDTDPMKFAVLYKRRGHFIVGPQGRTTAGVLIGVAPPVSMDATIDARELGKAVRDALGRSRSPVPHPQPDEWPAVTEEFLRATGVKTWGTFVRGSVLTTVEADGAKVVFQPHENRGARDAFQPMGLSSITIDSSATDEELGTAAMRALEAAAGE
jgi:hypothetical protein